METIIKAMKKAKISFNRGCHEVVEVLVYKSTKGKDVILGFDAQIPNKPISISVVAGDGKTVRKIYHNLDQFVKEKGVSDVLTYYDVNKDVNGAKIESTLSTIMHMPNKKSAWQIQRTNLLTDNCNIYAAHNKYKI